MRLSDIFRRLLSHFFSTRSTTETKETHQQYTSQSPPSSGTTIPKLPTTTTITNTSATMPGVTSDYGSSSKYDEIPGPLGLASASLQGKVALVTGAGKSESTCFTRVLDWVI
jgi:tetrahydroxynaphthalene reductase